MNIKIKTLAEIKKIVKQYKEKQKSIVFTNGCFDILHAGHVQYLHKAASFGDLLVIGINSDESVKLIKGDKRPIVNQEDRILVIAALQCVDYIVLFNEPDPKLLIKAICPNVLVKGEDWKEEDIIGGDFVKKNKGQIERIKFERDISTSKIIKKIRKLY